MPIQAHRGFILPLSILLVVVLTISGMGLLQHDYLERRLTSNNVDNQTAFYLANAGIERARAALQSVGQDNWSSILDGSDPNYAIESPPHPDLCGRLDPSDPCLILPFGSSVNADDPPPNPPFDASIDQGAYSVRAFNNLEEEDGENDEDGLLTIRAEGIVAGERKLLEATIVASSGLRLVNCDDAFGQNCPASGNPLMNYMDGREPLAFPRSQLPLFNDMFYRQPTNFPSEWNLSVVNMTGPVVFKAAPQTPFITNRTYYFVDGDVTIERGLAEKAIVFSTGKIIVERVSLSESILIGLEGISVIQTMDMSAPLPFPALISGISPVPGSTLSLNGGVRIRGNIWSYGPVQYIDAQVLEGVTIGVNGPVDIINVGVITDLADPQFYIPMPGFDYQNIQGPPGIVEGSWRELE